MAMDPTPAELQQMNMLSDVADWVKLPGAQLLPDTARGADYRTLGAEHDEHPRVIGAMSLADYETTLQGWKVGQRDPTPVEKTKVAMMGRVARILCGVQQSVAGAAEVARLAAEVVAQATAAQAALAQAQLASAAPQPKARIAKMSQVAEQGNEEEAPLLPEQAMIDGHRRYHALFKTNPREDEEITLKQLSCIQFRLGHGPPPWVEFSVFGPNGNRLLHAMKMTGMVIMPDGTLQSQEFKGPPSYAIWNEPYSVLQTGLLFLDTVELGPRDDHRNMIRRYAMAYPSLWHLVFQADSRMRHEHMERIRRRGSEATNNDPSHAYDTAAPLKWVWSEAVDDSKFWKRELEDPAFFVLTRIKEMGAVIDGDAAVTGADPRGTKRKAEEYLHHQSGAAATPQAPSQEADMSPPNVKKVKGSAGDDRSVQAGGKYTRNKKGKGLCIGYNNGSCMVHSKGFCSRDQSRVHQCHFCLQLHPAIACTKVLSTTKPKGKGKGRGK